MAFEQSRLQPVIVSAAEAPIRVSIVPDAEPLPSRGKYEVTLGELQFPKAAFEASISFEKDENAFTCGASISFWGVGIRGAKRRFNAIAKMLDGTRLEEEEQAAYALLLPSGRQNIMALEAAADNDLDDHIIRVQPSSDLRVPLQVGTRYFDISNASPTPDDIISEVATSVAGIINGLHHHSRVYAKSLQAELIVGSQGLLYDRSKYVSVDPKKTAEHSGLPTFEEFSGLDNQIRALREIIEDMQTPLHELEAYGLQRRQGVLLTGPSGLGKTSLVHAMANELGAKLREVTTDEIMTSTIGDPGQRLRKEFDDAAAHDGPYVLFFDEFDGLFATDAGGNPGASRSLIATLKTLLLGLKKSPNVIVAMAANSIKNVDPALLGPRRLGTHITFEQPSEDKRAPIFGTLICARHTHFRLAAAELPDLDTENIENLMASLNTAQGDDINPGRLADRSEGLSASDIRSIVDELLRDKMYAERRGETPAPIGHKAMEHAIAKFRTSHIRSN